MDIHEYQAKKILSNFGVTIPRGGIVYSPENAENKAREIGGSKWVVKAQIHSGARGKAGGIIVCETPLEVAQATDKLLGKKLVTNQTGPQGKIVNRIYIEEATDIEKELYLGDIIINLNEIKNKNIKKNFEIEFNRLWIHGLIHLFGHNHKKNKDFKKMDQVEKKYFKLVNG